MTRRMSGPALSAARSARISQPGTAVRHDVRYENSLLLMQFREFYREVSRLRRLSEESAPVGFAEPAVMAATIGGGTQSGGAAAQVPWSESASAPQVWQQLLAILERQAMEAGQTGGAFGFEIYREAQFVMAALADEIFINAEWDGRANWPLLESRLFQTHYAGEVIFQRIDRILQRKDPFYLDLATVYFLALSLGFQGRFRGTADRSALELYRRQLFTMILRRNPRLFVSDTALFPETYEHTMDKVAPRQLPDRRNWLWAIVGIVVLWLGLSHVAWMGLSSDIECLICRTTGAACACSTGPGK